MSEPLTHEKFFELLGDVEASIYNLRNAVTDWVYRLENEVARLERQNRELRGQIGKHSRAQQSGLSEVERI